MPPTGPTSHPAEVMIGRIEQRLALESQAIAAGIRQAWESYRWTPIPEQTQAAAWAQLLSFTSHLLGAEHGDVGPLSQAMATQAILRWLQALRLTPDDAVAWLLNPEADPGPLFEQLKQTANTDAQSQITQLNMRLAYDLLPAAQRVAHAQKLRDAFSAVDECLQAIPAWALIDELPALHGLCLQELQQSRASHAVNGEDLHPQQGPIFAQPTHQHDEARPVPGGVPGQA